MHATEQTESEPVGALLHANHHSAFPVAGEPDLDPSAATFACAMDILSLLSAEPDGTPPYEAIAMRLRALFEADHAAIAVCQEDARVQVLASEGPTKLIGDGQLADYLRDGGSGSVAIGERGVPNVIHSILPLAGGRRGVVAIATRRRRRLDEGDGCRLEALAPLLKHALDHAPTEDRFVPVGEPPAGDLALTEAMELQRQLLQRQKMESLGTMAGAVAHDFNNLLTTIMGFAGLLKRSDALKGEERENLTLIEEAARRAADLTGRLLAFARGGLVRFGPVDLRDVVDDMARLAAPALHRGLVLSVAKPPEPVMIEGDAGQVHQALINIVLNARDAMPGGGKIALRLHTEESWAVLEVEDDGPGMDRDTRLRIFEPFFSTKPSGSGTGLGMSIAYGIVQGHHGTISCESEPGRGTRFEIRLPLLESGAAAPWAPDPGDGNLVLVVDDDEMVRRTTTATLWQLGYSVAATGGGRTALDLLAARPERFAAVLLDLVMPGLTGSETFHELVKLRPDIPVVVVTGFAAEQHIDPRMQRRIAALIRKPFTAAQLEATLARVGVRPGSGRAGAG